MKKLFVVLMALALLVGASSSAFAAANVTVYGGGSGLGTIKYITVINTDAASSSYDVTNVSITDYIIPGKCQILGYSANATATAGLEGLFSLRDAASTDVTTDSYIMNENEVTASLPVTVWFPKPISVSRGLTTHIGPKVSLTVYYTQVSP